MKVLLLSLAALLVAGPVQAAEVRVLSAGAIEPALAAVAEGFRRDTGHTVTIEYATAPTIRGRAPIAADVVAAPPAVLSELAAAGRVAATQPVAFGRVGVGVAVKEGARVPDVSTREGLKAALSSATAVVYNRASTGAYVEGLVGRLGLAETLAPRTVRYADGEAVMHRLAEGRAGEIGLGAMTEIGLFQGKGVRLVGPLPRDVQNYTAYAVTLTASADAPARAFLAYLATPGARAAIAAAGVEP